MSTLKRVIVGLTLLASLLTSIHYQQESIVFRMCTVALCYDIWYNRKNPNTWLLQIALIYTYVALELVKKRYYSSPGTIIAGLTVVQLGDALQYFAGRAFGRTPIGWVSPKKTYEGYVTAAILLPVIIRILALLSIPYMDIPIWQIECFYAYGIISSLFLSLCKRGLGIKDWSNSLGAHGGFLDRADSALLLWAVPSY